MATIFKYNDKVYQCMSLEKKLKRLKASKENIEILYEGNVTQTELESKYLEMLSSSKKEIESNDWNPTLYYYINKKTGYSITSIYSSLEEMKNADVGDKSRYEGYEPTTLDEIENNKTE